MGYCKDITLINPPIRLQDKPRNFPHGLGSIAAVLIDAGIDVGVIDANALRMTDDMVITELQKQSPKFIGIGGMVTTYVWQKRMVPLIKKALPDAKIVLGGGLATACTKIVERNIPHDFLIAGEGEDKILREVFGIEPEDPISEDLDNLPITPYELFPMNVYLANPVVGFGRDMDMVTSRGCPYDCNFCYRLSGTKWRSFDVVPLGYDMEWVVDKFNLDFISFQDDCFVINKQRVYNICALIRNRLPNLKWSCTGRVGICDLDMLKEMKASGCVSVSYGIESGSDKMLKLMNKQQTAEQAAQVIRDTREAGMLCPTSFIFGYPGEGPDTIMETQNFCIDNQIPLSSLMYATPYPKTQLYQQVFGMIKAKFITEEKYIEALCETGDCNNFLINLMWPIAVRDWEWMAEDILTRIHDSMIEYVNKQVKPQMTDDQIKELYGPNFKGFDDRDKKHRRQHGFNLGD